MKKITAILGAAVLLGTVSCNVLDTPSTSSFNTESIYSSYALAERAVFGISEVFAENNSYYNRFLCYYGFNTDIEWYTNYEPNNDKDRIALYDCLPTNKELSTTGGNVYSRLYDGIERANLAIEGLKTYGNVDNDAQMRYLLAEATVLRSFMYYELTKAWGDVPARFEPITSDKIYLPRSSRDVIYKQILADLDEAIPYLPYPGATSQTSRTDRINKVFAEGLYVFRRPAAMRSTSGSFPISRRFFRTFRIRRLLPVRTGSTRYSRKACMPVSPWPLPVMPCVRVWVAVTMPWMSIPAPWVPSGSLLIRNWPRASFTRRPCPCWKMLSRTVVAGWFPT